MPDTTPAKPEPQALGSVPFKNDKQGSRVDVHVQITDLVRTNSANLRAAVDIVLVPFGLQLFSVPIFVKEGKISFAPTRRDIPQKSDDDDSYEYTFGFATKASRDIFKGNLMHALGKYCLRHHGLTLEQFLEVDSDPFDKAVSGSVSRISAVRPPSPSGGIHSDRYVPKPSQGYLHSLINS